jgi:diacylglycerol kinase (ATP)
MYDYVKPVAIVNPASKSNKTGKNLDALKEKISSKIPSIQFVQTRKPGDATFEARKAIREGSALVVAVGGDGTANEVANGFFQTEGREIKPVNREAVMGFLPTGTRNVLARSFSLPKGVEANLQRILDHEPITTDVLAIHLNGQKTNEAVAPRIFLNAAEIGEGARMSERSKKIRKVINSRAISTIATVVSTVPTYRSNQCELSIDGSEWRKVPGVTYCTVANGSYVAGGMKMAPLARLDDGLLDISILKDSGSIKLLDELVSIKAGDFLNDDNLIYRQAKSVSIRSDEREVGVTVEGEPVGFLPATFEIIPRALKFA